MLLRATPTGQRFYLFGPIVVGVAEVNPAVDAGVGMILRDASIAALHPRYGGGHDVLAIHYRVARSLIGTAVQEVGAGARLGGKVYLPKAALARRYGPQIAV